MNMEYESYLAHHGVPGMRWGYRKDKYKNAAGKLAGLHQNRKKSESSTWKSKEAGNLTDEELRRRLTRLQQEKQYKEMTASRATRAKKWIGKTAGRILVATAVGVLAKSASNAYTNMAKDVGMLPLTAVEVDARASAPSAIQKKRGEW